MAALRAKEKAQKNEEDAAADDGVVLDERELVGRLDRVLARRVEEARAGLAHEAQEHGLALLAHGAAAVSRASRRRRREICVRASKE